MSGISFTRNRIFAKPTLPKYVERIYLSKGTGDLTIYMFMADTILLKVIALHNEMAYFAFSVFALRMHGYL